MTFWTAILRAIAEILVAVVIPAAKDAATDTAETGSRDPKLRRRLLRRVRRAGWPAALLLIAAMIGGCGTRTVYVPSGEPVRLRETVRDAKIWARDANGDPVAGVMDLREGWYCLPDSPDDEGGD